jgi:hypothetical protein
VSIDTLLTKLAPMLGERHLVPRIGDRYVWDCGCWFIYGGGSPTDWRQGWECPTHQASRVGHEAEAGGAK